MCNDIYYENTLYEILHCVKSVSIRSYSGPNFPTFGLDTVRMPENADQNKS